MRQMLTSHRCRSGVEVAQNGAKPEQRRSGRANTTDKGTNIDDSGPDRTGGAKLGPPVESVANAIAALMDTPHPLDILGEPGSYGFSVSFDEVLYSGSEIYYSIFEVRRPQSTGYKSTQSLLEIYRGQSRGTMIQSITAKPWEGC